MATVYLVEVKDATDRRFRPIVGQVVSHERDAAEGRAQQYRAGCADLATRFRVERYSSPAVRRKRRT